LGDLGAKFGWINFKSFSFTNVDLDVVIITFGKNAFVQ
jgi:hypothetical protein